MKAHPKAISTIANEILTGKTKIDDVPAFRRRSVTNLIKIAKPDVIATMAAKLSGEHVEAEASRERDRTAARFFNPGRVFNVKS